MSDERCKEAGYGRPIEPAEWNINTLKQYLDVLLVERDRFYLEKLASADKAVSIAFGANKEAVAKAEQAQDAYNRSHNDLTRKMESQAHDMISRAEYHAAHTALIDLVERGNSDLDKRLQRMETGYANLQGRLWAVVAVAWIVGIAVNFIANYHFTSAPIPPAAVYQLPVTK